MVKEKSIKAKRVKSKATAEHPMQEPIEKLYNKSAPLLMFEGLLFIVAALLIFFRPIPILATLTWVFGVILALFGVYQTILGLLGGQSTFNGRWGNVLFGLINVALGAIFVIWPAGSIITVVYLFVILFFVKAIKALLISIQLWKYKFGSYMIDMVISVAMLVLAALMLFFPRFGAVTVMYYLGITLLLYAIADFKMYSELCKLKKLVS